MINIKYMVFYIDDLPHATAFDIGAAGAAMNRDRMVSVGSDEEDAPPNINIITMTLTQNEHIFMT